MLYNTKKSLHIRHSEQLTKTHNNEQKVEKYVFQVFYFLY
jgi:hypothetical protein